jgi:signal transduction histidine kinase
VLANADQLELALMNLAVNARDAMDGEGAFTITTRSVGGMVELRVADTGPGIADEALGRLFEPLFTTKPPGKGTGLGLAQVAGAVRQAGGSVEAASGADGGAVFLLRLRAAPVEDIAAAPAAAPAAEGA